MAEININTLFSDVLGDAEKQDKAKRDEAFNQASLVGTLGGMAAYLAPQRSADLSSSVGGLLGVDTRTESEKLKEQLQSLGTPQTDEEHKAYADLLDKIQAGSGVQYMMGIAAEKRREEASEADTLRSLTGKRGEDRLTAESPSLIDYRREQIEASLSGRVNETAQQTKEQTEALLSIEASRKIINRVSPELAENYGSLFPTTAEGAKQARDFALESIKAPTRDFIIETIVDDKGIPQRIVFDKNDETYKRVLGIDDSLLQGNKGKAFGNVQARSGVAIPPDAFNYKAQASKMLSIAFSPYLDDIVGPSETARLIPSAIPSFVPFISLNAEEKALRRDIDVTKIQGILPIIRLLAPVTDQDRELLLGIQPSTQDTQAVWIKRTLEEVIPQALNIMYVNLGKEGMSLAAAQQFGMASAAEVFNQIASDPTVFKDYDLEEGIEAAYAMLPRIENINLDEYPQGTKLFKDKSGRVYDKNTVQAIQNAKDYSPEEITQILGLELIEKKAEK